MKDKFGRVVDNLRISLTQKCNMHCLYCHSEGEIDSEGEMSLSEIEKIVDVCVRNGIRKIKLTGGEPLLRSDIIDIVAALSPMTDELSMTTNGILLSRHAYDLEEAGLARVNVSLDTLDPKRFYGMTGTHKLQEVLAGIEEALKAGLTPLKVNMVVTKKNADEIFRMIDFMRDGMILQLIEYEASRENMNDKFKELFFDLSPVEDELARRARRTKERMMQRRKKYFLPQEVEVVRSIHNTKFCAACNRLRVTSDGFLKPCLLRSDNHIDMKSHLSEDDKALDEIFKKSLENREPYWR